MQKKKQKNSAQSNPFSEMEKEVLDFWENNKIFEKSVDRKAKKGDYVFYDGPPFATGTPHYGHIVASIMKDVVPRYWTMRGYRVERRWGWDCHGLPIENIVEKEMGSKSKKDIEKIGVEKFNELCRSKVSGYVEDWKVVIRRLGRWADMENSYKTMDLDFMESVWYVFKKLWDYKLIYKGYRSMHICTRCETTLSQMEVAEGYKDIKDISATAKFELTDDPGTYILAWTTTPWTLIGNVALAVGKDIEYVKIKIQKINKNTTNINLVEDDVYIIGLNAFDNIFGFKYKGIFDTEGDVNISSYNEKGDLEITVNKISTIKGKDLLGKKYKPLFDYYSENAAPDSPEGDSGGRGWKIYNADFVTTEEGTGVVHIAPAFGEDDMNLGKKKKLPFVQHVGMDGVINKEVTDFAGMNVKPINDHMKTDIEIIKYLAHNNLLFAKEKYEHSYPHCWRCDTPLINYATSSWFVNILKIKRKMLRTAKEINWSPAHMKDGRFGNWLEGARDWSISRQRFWASVMPIWKCESCNEIKVYGSVKDLEKDSGEKITDLHKHVVDKIKVTCDKCTGVMSRVPDVLDTWFDSGSMPYAQMHYPFENKKKFEKNFPAEFIAEGVDQTRAWFYYLHAIANGIKGKHAFKNVIVNGTVLAEDGKKMSKKLDNYPDPMLVFDKYGADALRYYLLSSPVMLAENLIFSEKAVQESLRNVVMTLWNVYSFYEMYTESAPKEKEIKSKNVLDKWILARLHQTTKEVTDNMNNYNLPKATRPIGEFVNDLSTWYLRRSRDRFKGDDEKDKKAALETTGFVLLQLSKIMAPFMPFKAEAIWQKVTKNDFKNKDKSVHLESWSLAEKVDDKILDEMKKARELTEQILSARDERQFKIRQPLGEAIISFKLKDEYKKVIEDECNIKKISEGDLDKLPKQGIWRKFGDTLAINFELSDELKLEGVKRELVRFINALRKQAKMTIQDRAIIYWEGRSNDASKAFDKLGNEILKDTLSEKIINNIKDAETKKEVKINRDDIILGIKKV